MSTKDCPTLTYASLNRLPQFVVYGWNTTGVGTYTALTEQRLMEAVLNWRQLTGRSVVQLLVGEAREVGVLRGVLGAKRVDVEVAGEDAQRRSDILFWYSPYGPIRIDVDPLVPRGVVMLADWLPGQMIGTLEEALEL